MKWLLKKFKKTLKEIIKGILEKFLKDLLNDILKSSYQIRGKKFKIPDEYQYAIKQRMEIGIIKRINKEIDQL